MGSQSCLSPFLFFVGFSVTQCRELNSDNAYVAGTWSSVLSSVLFPLTILTILTTALRHGLQDHCTPLLVSRSRQRMLTDPGKDPMASLGPGGHYSTMRSDLPVPFPPQVTGACTDLKQAEQNKTPPVFQDEKRVIVLHFLQNLCAVWLDGRAGFSCLSALTAPVSPMLYSFRKMPPFVGKRQLNHDIIMTVV
jgi:hypothetical protein